MNYQLPPGGRRRKQTRDETKTRPVLFWFLNLLIQKKNRLKFHISIDEAVNIKLKLELFSWASFFHLIFEVLLRHRFSSDLWLHLTGPEVLLNLEACASSKGSCCCLDRLYCLRLTASCVTNIERNMLGGLFGQFRKINFSKVTVTFFERPL